ncbi:MAG: peptidase C1 [Ignavibacteriae bacterium HGW-Ignavibacteriae-2]|jgi:bleomycin hydrolase|nr:peptidase C1 [Bacteroidota bacterium]PKL90381.1 MAG: peptidase C1 [Ignavibacteriae bacterium HGW-Ignavibacteriae-2]
MKKRLLVTFIFLVTTVAVYAQNKPKDQASYLEYKNEFFKKVEESSEKYWNKPKTEKKQYKANFDGIDIPKSKEEFKYYWHNDPKDYPQGNTGTCWAFSGTSYFESEVYRLHGNKIKLSELYTAYWEFVEKARGFVESRGTSLFDHGSESNAVERIWKKYGIVPQISYTGLGNGQQYHDHSKVFSEMSSYLDGVKRNNDWNENLVVETIKAIMDHYFGAPPAKVEVDGKWYTPTEYFNKYVNLNFDDYVEFQSTIKQPYYKYCEFEVPDNWWHSKDYLNIPLDEFIATIKNSVRNGYSICIGGDVSEPGIDGIAQAAFVPEFDIPSEYINEYSREYRINNGSTGDDHGIHLLGYLEKDGKDWYLIKDSGSSSRNGNDVGYYFYTEDFVKLKMLSFMVHKEAAKDILKKVTAVK